MITEIIGGNLFDAPNSYPLVHCISSDFALSAGLARIIDKKYDVRNLLLKKYMQYEYNGKGEMLPVFNYKYHKDIYNLVTKLYYFNKPTYNSLEESLYSLRCYCKNWKIENLAMPKIGCGLDKLKWEKVLPIIKDIFGKTDINVNIYLL